MQISLQVRTAERVRSRSSKQRTIKKIMEEKRSKNYARVRKEILKSKKRVKRAEISNYKYRNEEIHASLLLQRSNTSCFNALTTAIFVERNEPPPGPLDVPYLPICPMILI